MRVVDPRLLASYPILLLNFATVSRLWLVLLQRACAERFVNVLISLLPSTVSTVHNESRFDAMLCGDEKFMHPDGSGGLRVDGALRTRCGRFFTWRFLFTKVCQLYTRTSRYHYCISRCPSVAMGPDAIRAWETSSLLSSLSSWIARAGDAELKHVVF